MGYNKTQQSASNRIILPVDKRRRTEPYMVQVESGSGEVQFQKYITIFDYIQPEVNLHLDNLVCLGYEVRGDWFQGWTASKYGIVFLRVRVKAKPGTWKNKD